MTQPTSGFGEVRPRARSASRTAWRIYASSALVGRFAKALVADLAKLRDPPRVPPALERRLQPHAQRLLRHRLPDDALAEANDVGVVVLPRQPGRRRLLHQRRA